MRPVTYVDYIGIWLKICMVHPLVVMPCDLPILSDNTCQVLHCAHPKLMSPSRSAYLIELSPAKGRDYTPIANPAWHVKLTGYLGRSFGKLNTIIFNMRCTNLTEAGIEKCSRVLLITTQITFR